MKNNKLFIFFSLLAIPGLFSSCSEPELPLNEIEDNYRTIYQIFPYSYADSNGDGVGDLKGIIDKLDYISSLNYTGLWLTPIHQSDTYHKYDVDDYMSIDEKFGTLEDYDNLVKGCHDRKMTILMDLVINHSSDTNQWFKKCIAAHQRNQVDNQYYNYYNVQKFSGGNVPSGYAKYNNSLIYEARFWNEMPDLNLQNVLDEPDGYLAKDLKKIFRFWLIEHHVDGFRLDAVTSYFTGDNEKNKQFLTWLNTACQSIKPGCYIVGEGDWTHNSGENRYYQESGVDSFFEFANSGAGGYIDLITNGDASCYKCALEKNKNDACGYNGKQGIPAVFVANHDTGHMIGCVKGRNDVTNLKFAHGVQALMGGTTFTYYGDEVGLAVPPNTDGRDENKRLPMPFGDSYTCRPVSGASKYDEKDVNVYGTVKNQINDKDSVINYVKKANLLRRQFPSLARGDFQQMYVSDNDEFCAVIRRMQGETILVCINASRVKNGSYTFDFSNEIFDSFTELKTSLGVDGRKATWPNKNERKIVIPSKGIAILK